MFADLPEDMLCVTIGDLDLTDLVAFSLTSTALNKIPQSVISHVAQKHNLPIADNIAQLMSFYNMTMYRKIVYGNLEYVTKNLATMREVDNILENTSCPEVFQYALARATAVKTYKLNGKQIDNSRRLGVRVGPQELLEALDDNDFKTVLLMCFKLKGYDKYLFNLARDNLTDEDFEEVLVKVTSYGASHYLKQHRMDRDGLGDITLPEYILKGNYCPELVKKYARPPMKDNRIEFPKTVTYLAILGDFDLANSILCGDSACGRINDVDHLIGRKLKQGFGDTVKINEDYIARCAIECDNIEVYERYKSRAHSLALYSPRSLETALYLIRSGQDISYSKCDFDYKIILEEFPSQVSYLILGLTERKADVIPQLIDEYRDQIKEYNMSSFLSNALQSTNFSYSLCKELVKRHAKVECVCVVDPRALFFCINELRLDKWQIRVTGLAAGANPETESEALRLGFDGCGLRV